MEDTRMFLRKMGLPPGDAYDLPSSTKSFPGGERYRMEVPGIQGPGAMQALLEEMDTYGIKVHRVTQTKGIMLLTDDEIKKMVELAGAGQVELVLAVGPRATYDTSASVHTAEGKRIGYRLRGQEQVVRALEDVKRAAALGCRAFLIYDEGCLWILNEMRKQGEVPPGCIFKVSAHCGHGNPCSARLLESVGADSINVVRDIQLQMLASLRQAVNIPLDVHTENPASSGGFIRHYEFPEIIRVGAPIYLKTGGSVARTHGWETTVDEAKKRARQVFLVQRVIETYYKDES